MEPSLLDSLGHAFSRRATIHADRFPLSAALAEGLGAGPSPVVADLYSRYFQILSAVNPDPRLMPAALHYLALAGYLPDLAKMLPSCGGRFDPMRDREALLRTSEDGLCTHLETALDFILSQQPDPSRLQHCPALLLGALAAADRFGGGLSLVEVGAGGGLNLRLDQYAYRFSAGEIGSGPVSFEVDTIGSTPDIARILRLPMPAVIARCGLDEAPTDLRDLSERLAAEAWFEPEQRVELDRFREAVALQIRAGRPPLHTGAPEHHLAALLVGSYNEMAPGNTLFIYQSGWSDRHTPGQRRQIASAIQRLAAQIQSRKPIAWLQAEAFTPGLDTLELRLHTFGWSDPEDRTVSRLAEVDPQGRWLRWEQGSYDDGRRAQD